MAGARYDARRLATIDEDEEQILHDLAGWMAVNGEAIFATPSTPVLRIQGAGVA